MTADPAELLAIAEPLAVEVAQHLRTSLAGDGPAISTKSTATDLVTELDTWAEAHITERLLAVRPHDAIVGEEGAAVSGTSGVTWCVDPIGGTVNLTIRRAGKELTLPVKAALAPETRDRDSIKLSGRTPFAGAVVANLSPAVAEELSMDADATGVVVSEVDPRSNAARFGFQKGDIILGVNNQPVESSRDLDRWARERPNFWRVTINRGGQVFTSVFGG